MAVRTIIQIGHPALKAKNEVIFDFSDLKLSQFGDQFGDGEGIYCDNNLFLSIFLYLIPSIFLLQMRPYAYETSRLEGTRRYPLARRINI